MKKIDYKTIFRFFWLFGILAVAVILVRVFDSGGEVEEPTGIASEAIFFVLGVWVGALFSQKKWKV